MARAARKMSQNVVVPARRRSALDGVLQQGRFGVSLPDGPGVRISLRHPLSVVTVIACKGKAKALDEAVQRLCGKACPQAGLSVSGRGLTWHWCGPEQWLAVRDDRTDGVLYGELREKLSGLASVSDQSHGRIVLSLSGRNARDVLCKGTPIDLHPRQFGPGQCALTQMAHIGVHLACTGPDMFELSMFRGFAESFYEWLTEMSLEVGYEVL